MNWLSLQIERIENIYKAILGNGTYHNNHEKFTNPTEYKFTSKSVDCKSQCDLRKFKEKEPKPFPTAFEDLKDEVISYLGDKEINIGQGITCDRCLSISLAELILSRLKTVALPCTVKLRMKKAESFSITALEITMYGVSYKCSNGYNRNGIFCLKTTEGKLYAFVMKRRGPSFILLEEKNDLRPSDPIYVMKETLVPQQKSEVCFVPLENLEYKSQENVFHNIYYENHQSFNDAFEKYDEELNFGEGNGKVFVNNKFSFSDLDADLEEDEEVSWYEILFDMKRNKKITLILIIFATVIIFRRRHLNNLIRKRRNFYND